jgi:DNA-directed RNA polymerase subunit RPC12/RpoP
MARQAELFDKPARRTRGQLMRVIDAGGGESGGLNCQLECSKCGHQSEWLLFDTVTEAKRGLPCPRCNAA